MSNRATGRLPRVYALADVDTLGRTSLCEAVKRMAGGGVRWIQIRAKKSRDDELFEDLDACCRALEDSGVEIWINDRPDLAKLHPVHGVHLGQDDLQPLAARSVLTPQQKIGRSTHTEAQVRKADADDSVDVIAIGPVFATSSKCDAESIVGIEGVRRARLLTSKLLVGIGGIDENNLDEVLVAGADAAAMLGAICHGEIENNCRLLVARAEAAV